MSIDPVTAYAREVVSGEIVAGLKVQQAMERHLRDLRDGPARGLHWRPEIAQHVLDFFPTCLTITGGALAGKPFKLLPYAEFVVGSWAGWRHANGLRRFRTIWLETGKGQAKSPLMAALGLYGMRFEGVSRAEIYAIANIKEQANVLFKDAVSMVRARVPDTCDRDEHGGMIEHTGVTLEHHADLIVRGSGHNAWRVEWDGASAGKGVCFFQSLANSDSISGPRPYMVFADEIHEHKTDDAIETWSQALAKMPGDPLMVLGTNTPAADQRVGCDYSDFYGFVADGTFKDDSSLAFIATTDEGDDPMHDESCWRKSLPALGITFDEANIRSEVEKSAALPSKALNVKRLYFGIRTGVAECWIDWAAWLACERAFSADDMIKAELPCTLSLDLSSRKDFTSLSRTWRDTENKFRRGRDHLFHDTRYFTPRDTLDERSKSDKAPYTTWAADGRITAVSGPVIDKLHVAQAVKALTLNHNILRLVFDIAQIIDFEAAAREIALDVWTYEGPTEPTGTGLQMVRHSQGFRGMASDRALWMPRSVERTEDAILNANLSVQPNPLTRFCSSNTVLSPDDAGNRAPTRKRSRGRIDGTVTLIMGVGAAMDGTSGPNFSSIFDSPAVIA